MQTETIQGVSQPAPCALVGCVGDADEVFAHDLIALMRPLARFAQRLSRDRSQVDDLVQETLTKAWRARRSFNAGTNLLAWLCRILRNEHHSRYRKDRRWRELTDSDTSQLVSGPDSQIFAVELAQTVRALQRLPPLQRETLLKVGFDSRDYAEAARHLGCKIGTVKSRITRARQSLRATVAGDARLKAKPSRNRHALAEGARESAGLNPLLTDTHV
jgi:RNA polymerase sigma-70 factor (ECF subfamily)